MEEIQSFFGELLEEKNCIPMVNASDKIIISTEMEFGGENFLDVSSEEASRKSEEETLQAKKKEWMIQLKKCKNIKNANLSHINHKRSEKRKHIKKEIAEIDLRLQEIEWERSGPSSKKKA